MSSLLYALGRLCYQRWRAVVALWLVAMTLAGVGALTLGAGAKDVFRIPGVESFEAFETLQHRFPEIAGANGQVIVVAAPGEKVTDDDHRARIERVARQIADVDQTAMVLDPWDDLLSTQDTITPSGDAALINVAMNTSVEMIEPATQDRLVEIAEKASDDELTFTAGGGAWGPEPPVIGISEAIGVVVAFAVLAFTFGSFIAAGLPLLSAGAGLAVGLGLIWIATKWLVITTTGPFLALMIGLAVGIDYSLFLLARHRDELAKGVAPDEAAGRATGTAGSAVVFAGLTVVIALSGLVVTGIPFLALMGLAAALSVLTAIVASLTITPAMFGILGARLTPRQARQRKPSFASRLSRQSRSGVVPAPREPRTSLNERWLNLVMRFPKSATLLVVGILVALSVPAFNLTTALPDNGTAAEGTTQREVYEQIGEKFGPGYNSQIVIAADALATEDPVGFVEDVKRRVLLVDNVQSVPIATPNPPDGDIAVVQVTPETAPNDPATVRLVQDLRDLAPAIAEDWDIDIEVTGMTGASVDITDRLNKAAIPFVVLVMGLSLILLAIVFRSIAVPIKAAINFLLSVGATIGVVVLVFQEGLWSEPLHVVSVGAIVCFLPILMISLLFGLAVDYEVFLISRMREEYVHGASATEAIRSGYLSSSKVITAAAVIMIAVFAAFYPHGDAVTQPIAFALAVGVFIDAFMVRITLLPAVMVLLGDKAWWMPKWLDKRLPVLDVEGEGVNHQLALADWPYADAHLGVHADRIQIRTKADAPVLGPISFEIPPGDLLLARGQSPQTRTALALILSGRMKTTHGKLKVAGYVVPEQMTLLRPKTALVRLTEENDPLTAVRRALTARTRVLVVDGLETVPSLESRDAIVAEVREIASARGVAALLTLDREALEALGVHDPSIRVIDVQTSRVTPLGSPVTEGALA